MTARKAIVIPGGPGLSPSYLRPYIDECLGLYKCHYVDHSSAKTAKDAVSRTAKALNSLRAGDIVLAHSWGSFLALESMKRLDKKLVAPLILLNPVPLTSTGLPLIQSALTKRLKSSTLAKIDQATAEGGPQAGQKIFSLALRAYTGHVGRLPQLEISYWPERDHAVSQTQTRYSHKSIFNKHKASTLVLFGQSDYITPALFDGSPAYMEILPGGHFGFAEQPLAYKRAIVNFLLRQGNT